MLGVRCTTIVELELKVSVYGTAQVVGQMHANHEQWLQLHEML